MIRLLLLFSFLATPALAQEAVVEQGAVKLFSGEDFSGWSHVLKDPDVPMEEVWSIREGGVLHCKGRPVGYLRTDGDYENYRLELDWRWPAKPGNNGVLVHTSTPDELGVWPKCLEVQLQNGQAGDFWVIGAEIDVPNEDERVDGRRHKNLTDDSEHELGEWNHMVIDCFEDAVNVYVNGELVNAGTNSSVTEGAICLQSEGAPIEYRNITIAPVEAMPEAPKKEASSSGDN